MSRQSYPAAVEASRIAAIARKDTAAIIFAAGEKHGEQRGFRKGMACAALLTCAGFLTGLVLSVEIIPLLVWWLS